MSEHKNQNRDHGPKGRWGYDSRTRRNHLDGSSLPSYRMERNGSTHFDSSSGYSGGSTIAISSRANAKWFPYRIAVIIASGTITLTGLTLYVIACLRNVS